MDRKPKLDVTNLESPESLKRARRSVLKKVVGPAGPVTSRVLSKYRARQRKLLRRTEEDPDPYDERYIFYCLDSPPTE
jgi:hypothetical protein